MAIAYTDFKERSVPVYLLVALLGICIMDTALQIDVTTALWQLAVNTGLILLLLSTLLVYYRFKQGSFKEVINQKLGMGDVVFWIAITPLFSLFNFILFFIASLLIVLIIMLIRVAYKKPVTLIPLAGYQALVLVAIILSNLLFSIILFP
ncbi:hypothetical protein MKP07_19360 [Niabella hibiscisoli]|nr:hypothetical protein [Niabella hibiscisoli]MCH5718193.1 hypothetical protein [Niabella hibiscisoli]